MPNPQYRAHLLISLILGDSQQLFLLVTAEISSGSSDHVPKQFTARDTSSEIVASKIQDNNHPEMLTSP